MNDSAVLALNSGSSSLKFGLYRCGPVVPEAVVVGEAQAIGKDGAEFRVRDAAGRQMLAERGTIRTQEDAVRRIGALLAGGDFPSLSAIGHRIVHGGPRLLGHCLVDGEVVRELEAAAALAPLHAPQALSVMRFARARFPRCPHVACLDTAFHSELPDVARVLPVPAELRAEGVRRYGFHGLSCESIVRQLGERVPERLVVAHLGNGASITAVRRGRSIDTTMGLTPSGGVVMGTRSGDLDPGVMLYLLRKKPADAAWLEDLIDRRSGLLGISGIDGDMRRLHEKAGESAEARLAIEIFCYAARKVVAGMIAVLEGIDLLVFSGGIGENDPAVRAAICAGLEWQGVRIDPRRNAASLDAINAEESRCEVRVMPASEETQIALHTRRLVEGAAARRGT